MSANPIDGIRRIPLYTFHERAWHWVQAVTILALLVTGAEIHAPEAVSIFGFRTAVLVHNAFAVLLLLNAAMGLFYFVTSGMIRQFGPQPRDFVTMSLAQVRFYAYGIFRGEPHPMQHDAEHKLNPLQQVTYLVTLNVLLPLPGHHRRAHLERIALAGTRGLDRRPRLAGTDPRAVRLAVSSPSRSCTST